MMHTVDIHTFFRFFKCMGDVIYDVEINEIALAQSRSSNCSAESIAKLSEPARKLKSHMSTMLGFLKSVLGAFSPSLE